jgi:RNA polymerase sigma-70 factor (ECF subfamily)
MTERSNVVIRAESCSDGSRARHAAPDNEDDGLSAFLSTRPRLFAIAYRMLHNAAEAEEVVQDAWIRWQTTDRGIVRDATAFLVATTTRLAINVMQSARRRRETNLTPTVPEPADTHVDAGTGAERGEALRLAVLLLLEKLSTAERMAYVLREAFDYSYREIANVLGLEEANTRQLVTRARHRMAGGRRRRVRARGRRPIVTAFVDSLQRGDFARFERLFAAEVASLRTAAVAA